MITRAGSGWQTAMADLSLILFMVTAVAVNERPGPRAAPAAIMLPALGEPVAVWRSAAGAPGLRDWLRETALDPNLRLTLLASADQAEAALALAAGAGRPARIVIEADARGPVAAVLTYDQAAPLAQGLQTQEDRP